MARRAFIYDFPATSAYQWDVMRGLLTKRILGELPRMPCIGCFFPFVMWIYIFSDVYPNGESR